MVLINGCINKQIDEWDVYYYILDYSDEEDEGDDILTCINDHGIYENYGPNNGNKWMSILDLQQYVKDKDKDGLSSEYYSIKNEPLSDSFDSFKYVSFLYSQLLQHSVDILTSYN